MTYSRENSVMPVDVSEISFQESNVEGKAITVDYLSHACTFDPIPMTTVPHLKAIDMSSANTIHTKPTEDMISENVVLEEFQKLSMNESYMDHDASKRLTHVGHNSACETTMVTATRTHELAKDMLLFVGDEDGDTPLHNCIMLEDEVNTILIINRAPDFMYLSVQNRLLQTPVHLATLINSPKIIRKLICAGADIQCQDKNGNTALHLACVRGYLEIVKQLLRPVMYRETLENKYPIPYMAIPQNMNVKNYDGLTCLHLAVLSQDLDIVRLLLEAGADPNIGDSKSGRTPLHMAAEQGLLDIVSLLISYRTTEIDAMNYAGHTPAHFSFSRGHSAVTRLLFRFGASREFYYNDSDQDSGSSDEENSMDV